MGAGELAAVNVALAALASYRVARMLAQETGPFALFRRFREAISLRFPGKGRREHWIAEGVSCPLCEGFYISPLFFGLIYLDYVKFAVYALAVAGLQTFLQKNEKD